MRCDDYFRDQDVHHFRAVDVTVNDVGNSLYAMDDPICGPACHRPTKPPIRLHGLWLYAHDVHYYDVHRMDHHPVRWRFLELAIRRRRLARLRRVLTTGGFGARCDLNRATIAGSHGQFDRAAPF